MTVEYDSSAGIVASACRYFGTIIPMVIDGPEFWIFLVMNSIVCFLRHFDLFHPKDYNIDLPWDLTGTTGSLMTFFVVFYNSHVFTRYNKLYDLTKAMFESAVKVCAMLKACIPDERVQWKVSKYVFASILIFFFERTTSDDDDHVSKIEWRQLKSLELLDDEELHALRDHCQSLYEPSLNIEAAMPSFMPILWSQELVRYATDKPEDRDDMLHAFYTTLYRVWNCQSQIHETLELPMPFQYFHIMNLMLCLNLFLWAYSLGCQESLFAPIIYMFVQMMFQGLRELSTALSDPYGTDEVDFALNDWIYPLYSQMYAALQDNVNIHDIETSGIRPLVEPDYATKFINMYVDRELEEEEHRKRLEKKKEKKRQKEERQKRFEGLNILGGA